MHMTTPHPVECGGCGIPVQSQAKKSAPRYCSNACRQRAYRQRTKNREGLGASSAIAVHAQLTPLIGRADEQVELERRLQSARLVTLTGPAGVGKTRLALHTAMQEQRRGQAAVVLAELSQVTDARDLLQRLTAGFEGSGAQDGRPAQRDSNRLLILDTCEHLLVECNEILSTLYARYPALRVLATSREPLFFPGETVSPMSGLPYPEAGARESAAEFMRFPAVRLFVERVRAVSPEFQLDEANSADVGTICARLDGIPLAIELAAQLVRAFPVAEIHRRLGDRLDFLTGGWRLADPRHQSLRAAFDWSYELLTPDEQQLFQALSLLPDGFGLDAATGAARGAVSAPEVPNLIAALEAKSLIGSYGKERSGFARFRILESVRQYAHGKLIAEGHETRARDGIIDRFVEGIATFPETGLLTPECLGVMERERETLSYALESLSAGGDERQIPLAAALDVLDMMKGFPPEECRRLSAALKRVDGASTYRTNALALEALLAVWRGEYQRAATLVEEAGMAGATCHPVARWRAELVLDLVRQAPENAAAAWRLRKSLESSLRFRDPASTGVVLYALARYVSTTGCPDGISGLVAEALRVARTEAQTGPFRALLVSAGALALADGDFEQAESRFVELLHEAQDNPFWAGRAIEGLAVTSVHAGRYEHALRLLAATQTPEAPPSYGMGARWQARVETAQSNAFAAVSPAKADQALTYGRALGARQIVDYALGRQEAQGVESRSHGPLSQRQWEISALLSQGLTNRQIAARLFVSVRTVETHVQNIRVTLGLKTRAHVAAWATHAAKPYGNPRSEPARGLSGKRWNLALE